MERDEIERDDGKRDDGKVAVTGASGLVGSALVAALEDRGRRVVRLVRRNPDGDGEIRWDPAAGVLDPADLEGIGAVVHLAGENIASGPWTRERKRRIHDSRVDGTRLVAGAMAAMAEPPQTFVCASAVGYYGDRGDRVLEEDAEPGEGFLAEVCRGWEAAADPARERGVRVVHPRIGVVLSADGGALAKMLLPFKLGLGGVLGSGKQYMSWIDLDDLVAVILHAMDDGDLDGAVNAVAPEPVTNREFTRTLGRVLHRPTILPAPAFALRLLLGEMAEELFLASTRAVPARLRRHGFTFRHPQLEGALRHRLEGAA
jgi:uncharacterized protein (TIGR01777 family)